MKKKKKNKKKLKKNIKLGLGREFVLDERDQQHSIQIKGSSRSSRYWYDYSWFGDQGNTSSCVGFSWAHWLNSYPIKQYLNPYGIYTLAQYLDEWEGEDYDGSSVRAGAKVLKMLGFIEEYKWGWGLNQVIDTILEVGPVVVGTTWYSDMFYPDYDGYIHVGGSSAGGHAYLLSGVDVNREKFRIKNSWGREWGNYGWAWISFSDFSRLINENGECCLGVEQRAKPDK